MTFVKGPVYFISSLERPEELSSCPSGEELERAMLFILTSFIFFFLIPFLWETQRKKKERANVTYENAQGVHSGRVDISRETTA